MAQVATMKIGEDGDGLTINLPNGQTVYLSRDDDLYAASTALLEALDIEVKVED